MKEQEQDHGRTENKISEVPGRVQIRGSGIIEEQREKCGGNGREPLLWAPEQGEPTCKICLDLAMLGNGDETNETDEIN
ncbi:MAG: hypothetical protein ABIU06_04095 [Anaerolineales bacterium]